MFVLQINRINPKSMNTSVHISIMYSIQMLMDLTGISLHNILKLDQPNCLLYIQSIIRIVLYRFLHNNCQDIFSDISELQNVQTFIMLLMDINWHKILLNCQQTG